jgi:hypothetical protein
MVPVKYSQIRTWHFRETLARWLQGLDKAAMAVTAVAGPGMVALVVLLLLAIADGLTALSTASNDFTYKFSAVCAWQLLTLGMLWSLREAIFMPQAAAFFAALPVKPSQHLRADLVLCMLSYSLLWLAVAWAIGRGFFGGTVRGMQVLLTVATFVAFSLTSNLLLLRLGLRALLVVVMGLLAFALPGSYLIYTVCAMVAVVLMSRYLWRTYQQPRSLAGRQGGHNTLVEAVALRTGLAILLFANELRAALLLRSSCVLGLLSLVPLLATYKQGAGLEIAGFVVVMAAATIAFYDLPALCRSVAFNKLRFIAGQRNFVRRINVATHGMQWGLYLGTLLGARYMTLATLDSDQGLAERLLVPSAFFAATFLAGTAAANLEFVSIRWLMPVVNFVAAIIMSGFV